MQSNRDLMGGFAKGLRVIEAFREDRTQLSIAEAAEIADLDRATARRCLLTLAELGYASYDGKFFALTPMVLRLGQAWLSAAPLPKILQPHLDNLSEAVVQSASASILDGNHIVYIARAAQQRVMSINLMPGSRLPAYCSSMGRVLLAAQNPTAARAILERSDRVGKTPYTVTDVDALMLELSRVREQGFAIVNQELEVGLCSIAVPVINRHGHTVAAINVGTSMAVISASELESRLLGHLLSAQAALKSLLNT